MLILCQENGFSHDIPTTVHRSKADCPVPEVINFFFSLMLCLVLKCFIMVEYEHDFSFFTGNGYCER